MATVHLARQSGAGGFARMVAIKRLHERYARDPEFVGMLLDEARLVARLRHPNVVQTVDVVVEGDELFLVMEYVHGESLVRLVNAARKRGVPIHPSVAASIAVGVLHGLHHAHEALDEAGAPMEIVHRDVSPHNILVGTDGISRVLDFGIAKASSRLQATQDGQLKGKLSYMAPEQVSGAPVDRRTDVYAAAICLWESLTGGKLFHGSNDVGVIQHILKATVLPPGHVAAGVPRELDEVVLRALDRDPRVRFQTALEFANAIERTIVLAHPSEVAAWVLATSGDSLAGRARMIQSVEAQSSSMSARTAAESIRSITGSRPAVTLPMTKSAPVMLVAGAPAPPAARSIPPGSDPTGVQLTIAPRAKTSRMVIALMVASGMLVASLAASVFVLVRSGAARQAAAGDLAKKADGPVKSAAPAQSASVPAAAPSVVAPPICPSNMIMVTGGRFFMGSDDDLPAERPAHKVTLGAFCIDRWEVTADAYRACSDRGDCKRAPTSNRWEDISPAEEKTYDPLCNGAADGRGKHPINCVDWFMADRFCKAEGKRLPTEAEWEYAARGSDGRKYPWGDAPPSARLLNACGAECVLWGKKRNENLPAMYREDDGWSGTAPVGSFPLGASRWGLEDVVGNVWEWVADPYGPYAAEDQTDPKGPTEGSTRVIRGGAWNGAEPDWVRPTFRFHNAPDTRSHGIGFRCAM